MVELEEAVCEAVGAQRKVSGGGAVRIVHEQHRAADLDLVLVLHLHGGRVDKAVERRRLVPADRHVVLVERTHCLHHFQLVC